MAAAFSAIIKVGEFVLPLVIRGMTEASQHVVVLSGHATVLVEASGRRILACAFPGVNLIGNVRAWWG